MEKILYIIVEICAILLSLSMVYHYFVNHCDGMVLIFSGVFAWAAFWCHVIQKNTKFRSKLW